MRRGGFCAFFFSLPWQRSAMAAIDDFNFAVALQMLQVREDLAGRELGKLSREDDKALAIAVFQEELREARRTLQDRRIAQSMSQAVESDAALLQLMEAQEESEREDRAIALSLARQEREQAQQEGDEAQKESQEEDPHAPPRGQGSGCHVQRRRDRRRRDAEGKGPQNDSKASPAVSDVGACTDAAPTSAVPASSNPPAGASIAGLSQSRPQAAARPGPGPSSSRQLECLICMDKFDAAAARRAPCSHIYCNGCFSDLCKAAAKDRTLMPVQCCKKDFPQDWVQRAMTPEQWGNYQRILAELSQAAISARLDPEFRLLVAQAGGKICPACGRGIDLAYGCNITSLVPAATTSVSCASRSGRHASASSILPRCVPCSNATRSLLPSRLSICSSSSSSSWFGHSTGMPGYAPLGKGSATCATGMHLCSPSCASFAASRDASDATTIGAMRKQGSSCLCKSRRTSSNSSGRTGSMTMKMGTTLTKSTVQCRD